MRRFVVVALVLLVAVLGMAPAAIAEKGGTNRPFKADLVGGVTFEFPSPDCPGPKTITDSYGTASHMGAVVADWSHCPLEVGFVSGALTVEAANGDELYFDYENPEGDNPFLMSANDGTGRFEGATGSAYVMFEVVPQFLPPDVCMPGTDPFNPMCFDLVTPWPWWGSIEGTISY